jgi:hypothetical protein
MGSRYAEAGITVGGYYRRVIVPDTEPLLEVPTFKAGDQVLHLVKWAGSSLEREAVSVDPFLERRNGELRKAGSHRTRS